MRDHLQIGALCWLTTAQFFLAQMIVQAWFPNYSLVLFDISLLGISQCGVYGVPSSGFTGELCSPLHLVFNASLILHGLTALFGVWLTRSFWPSNIRTSMALALLALGGAGAVIAGFFPLDLAMTPHVVGAIMALGLPGAGLVLLAWALWQSHPGFARFSAFIGVVILIGGLGHAMGGGPLGRGTMERLAAWPQTIWYTTTGFMLATGALQRSRPRLVLRHLAQGGGNVFPFL